MIRYSCYNKELNTSEKTCANAGLLFFVNKFEHCSFLSIGKLCR